MTAYLEPDEATELYDAYRFTADDCVSVQNVVERILADRVQRASLAAARKVAYEGGMWCGECDPADADDDCCVLPHMVRAYLDEVSS